MKCIRRVSEQYSSYKIDDSVIVEHKYFLLGYIWLELNRCKWYENLHAIYIIFMTKKTLIINKL